jgi:UDPglucose 6-dehydrogenase
MITVLGLWHLGCVTAACCAKHFKTVGLDFDQEEIEKLKTGRAPLHEPGLDELISEGLASGNLSFSCEITEALKNTQVLWITYDTPVDENDIADVDFVIAEVSRVISELNDDTVVLISSQLPVGSIKLLENKFKDKNISFAYSPENLRLGNAINIFTDPDRIVVGVRNEQTKNILEPVLEKFSKNIIWMSPESAEMTKHAINCFLAMSVSFANELASICEVSGANAHEVASGLKSESRIGEKAYVGPGGAFAGGTLARDVQFLSAYRQKNNIPLSLIPTIKSSNDRHKSWPLSRLKRVLGNIESKKVAVLGLTYKPGTDTLRRSSSVELCKKLLSEKVQVSVFDPSIKESKPELDCVQVETEVKTALEGAEAVVIMTEWPEFKEYDWKSLLSCMTQKIVIDQNRFCEKELAQKHPELQYLSVGVP